MVVLVAVLGVVLYAAIGHHEVGLRRRLVASLGGTLLWLVTVVAALLIGGVF